MNNFHLADYKKLLQSMQGLYLILLPDFTIVDASDTYLEATMTERAKIAGRPLFEIFPENPNNPDDPNATGQLTLTESLNSVLTNKAPHAMGLLKYDIARTEAEGGGFEERYWRPYNSPVLNENNEVIYIINHVEDITEKIRLEEELVRSNEFAYIASHDLQEPLRTITNFTGLLERDFKDKLDEEGKDYMHFITTAASRMQQLIKDLLDFSRLGWQKTLVEVDCNEMLTEVLLDMDSAIMQSNAVIRFNNLPVIKGLKTELKQLFQNLISNAIKFSRNDVIPEIEISAEKKDFKWVFAVKDNGIGIDKKYYDRIFLIFQRLHSATEYPGTGIGLATCKKIVDLHRGEIWVQSQPGQGTTFYFTILQKEGKK